ncbi:MAG: glycosyltransferase family 4 protein [Chloracidobacterium sp.]|nr:glycosyltransferase family 4 protein [Chloracidobacterium sp.]
MSETSKDRKRLWVISELYYPEMTSTGYYLTLIAEGLADRFEVKAISGQPNYSARGTRAAKHEWRNGVEIFRAAGTTLDKNVIVFRVTNMVTLGLSVLIRSWRQFRAGDKVLVVTNPPLMPFVAAIAALARGASYTLLVHDNYPEILVAAGKIRESSFTAKAFSFLNRWLYKHAAGIVVVGRDMAELMERKTAGLSIPIENIPNWAELETVSPRPRDENSLLAELGLSGKFVLLYAGNMGPPNDVETIIEVAEQLRAEPKVHFVFLGAGAKRPWIEREIGERGLDNVTVLDPRPRSDQPLFLNACDVALVSLIDKMLGVSGPEPDIQYSCRRQTDHRALRSRIGGRAGDRG